MPRRRLDRLFAALHSQSDAPAITFGPECWTYEELSTWSLRYAHRLRELGVEPGDRVAALCPPSHHLVAAMLGAYGVGATWVPLNPRYPQPEVEHVLDDCRPRVLWVDQTLRGAVPTGVVPTPFVPPMQGVPRALPIEATDASVALIIYTSGTTGRSKGVQLSHRAVVDGIGSLVDHWEWSAADTLSLMLPLFHVHGLGIGIHGALLHGMHVLLHPRFEPEKVVRDVAERDATVFMGVPTMYTRLLRHLDEQPGDAERLRAARLFTSGSAALPATDFARFEQLTGHRILERYGMTETLLTLSNPYAGERRPGAVGFPILGVEIRIVDDEQHDVDDDTPGELWVRTVGMMTGYWERPEATADAFAEHGWFRTGDVVSRDADGYVHIVGRRSVDIIKSGGFKIGAREIEDVIAKHPAVDEVAVYGTPDREWGEVVTAAVVAPRGPDDEALLMQLQTLCEGALADYKKVRKLRRLDALPRNAMGKVQKARLKDPR